MKRGIALLLGSLIITTLSGCGQDRTALARQTVQTYWNDISKARIHAAYNMLTSGNRQSMPFSTYDQDIMGILTQTAHLQATVGNPKVKGDNATVPVTLHSIRTTKALPAYQHLYWENGAWRITDQNGGVSQTP